MTPECFLVFVSQDLPIEVSTSIINYSKIIVDYNIMRVGNILYFIHMINMSFPDNILI